MIERSRRSMRIGPLAGLLAVSAAAACGGAGSTSPVPSTAATPRAAAAAACERRHPGVGAVRTDTTRQSGAVAVARADSTTIAYVADEDEDSLRTMDVDVGAERAITPLAGSPSQVLVLADGRVAVAIRNKNVVQILEPTARAEAPLEPLCQVAVPSEPVALAATPDDASVLVTSAWAHKLTALDGKTLAKQWDAEVPREPRAVVVDDDGQRAFVAHVVNAKMSVVDLASGKHDVREIDLRVRKLSGSDANKLRGGCQGFALAKSISDAAAVEDLERPKVTGTAPKDKAPAKPKGRVFAPMVTVDPGEATVRSSGYGNPVADVAVEAPIVSVVDAGAERPLTKHVLSDGQRHTRECLLPRAAAYDSASSSLLVACLGNDALVELDGRGFDPARLERRRWAVPAGPTGVAVDARKHRAIVWSQFDRELSIVSLEAPAPIARVLASRTARNHVSPQLAWGRELFHKTDDARVSGDGRACASCHPDGREDALTWSTPEGPRQTIMLAGRLEGSAPYAWFGHHKDLKTHVKTTFQRLGGIGLPDQEGRFDELDALTTYLGGMPMPVPDASSTGEQGELVARGKKLFFDEAQGCASCHVGGPGTDAVAHDVGSSAQADGKPDFDTPTLRFVSGTAPYFHDGRYSTLHDLLSASDSRMGHTMQLSHRDRQAMEAYLETL